MNRLLEFSSQDCKHHSTRPPKHLPVLKQELLDHAPPSPQTLLDCTLGGGGHSLALLHRFPHAKLVGLDQDALILESVRGQFSHFMPPPSFYHARFSQLQTVLKPSWKFDYIVADLGVSSFQLDEPERGFSLMQEGPLDMRMDSQAPRRNAQWWVNEAPEKKLVKIFQQYGEERFARKIARGIVQARAEAPFDSTRQLAEFVASLIPRRFHKKKIHAATLVFQALRIAVNDELEELQKLLDTVLAFLAPGGRLACISFHSLEDRIIKKQFQQWETPCQCPRDLPLCVCGRQPLGKQIVKRPIQASLAEIKTNPRSRSAKLRVFERGTST